MAGITNLDVVAKYVLVYNGTTGIVGVLHTGRVSTSNDNTVEVFNTEKEFVDRGLELNLEFTPLI